jgi:hypothetical protein
MRVTISEMVLNATSPEHLATMVSTNYTTFYHWLMERLAREDDDSDHLVFAMAWSVNHHDCNGIGSHLHKLLLRDCQERIGEYLDEELSRDLNEDDYYDENGQRIIIDDEEEIESVCA